MSRHSLIPPLADALDKTYLPGQVEIAEISTKGFPVSSAGSEITESAAFADMLGASLSGPLPDGMGRVRFLVIAR